MSDELLCTGDYIKILQNRFGRTDLKFISAAIISLEDVEGFLGEHYKLEITYEDSNENKIEPFFIKTKPRRDVSQRELLTDRKYYKLETYLYGVLFKEFEKYGFDTSFAPKCYLSIEDETMVMDDKIVQGFSLPDRKKYFNLNECKVVLKSLAQLHASGFMYEEKRSKELGRRYYLNEDKPEFFEEELFPPKEKRTGTKGAFVDGTVEMLIELIKFLPESESFKQCFIKKFQEAPLEKIFLEETTIRKTCTHGDLWSNNMLFKIENNVVTQCCLVDYQMCRYFYPTCDLILFLYSNTEKVFRDEHLESLYEFYYNVLSDILNSHGFSSEEIFSKIDFKKSIDIVDFVAKLQACIFQSLVRLPRNILSKYMIEEKNGFSKLFFEHRVAMGVDAFNNNEEYRRLLTDYLYELHKSLFQKH